MPGQKHEVLEESKYCHGLVDEANERLEEQSRAKFFSQPSTLSGVCELKDEPPGPVEVEIRPCFELRWGEGPNDQLETDDVEILQIVATNPYPNVVLKDVSVVITNIYYQDQPVAQLPNGAASVEIRPSELIHFGDLLPCSEASGAAVVREVTLVTRWALAGEYTLSFQYCHAIEFIQPGKDMFRFDIVPQGCRSRLLTPIVLLPLIAILLLVLLLTCLTFLFWRPVTDNSQTFIYSANYTCWPKPGRADGQMSPAVLVADLTDYKTVVNVHNFWGEEVKIQRKVIAFNNASPVVTGPFEEIIGPDDIFQIDCQAIASIFEHVAADSATGFVVIESPRELEVAAVYIGLIYDREKDDQTTDETSIERDEISSTEGVNKYLVRIKILWLPMDETGQEILAEMGLEAGSNEIEVIAPTPTGPMTKPEESIRLGLIQALRQKFIEKGIEANEAQQRAETFVKDDVEVIEILDIEFGLGKGQGLGLGVGRGIGRGIGVGIGAGISIDVEYIEPRITNGQPGAS